MRRRRAAGKVAAAKATNGATKPRRFDDLFTLSPLHGGMTLLPALIGMALFVNLLTMLLFWQDKRRAIAGGRRIREADLLGLALVGGSPGALLARRLFRHKTRKRPFSTQLMLIAALQLGALIGLAAF
jgi:uncharacterized membrane protein YsdA (DUF1294 family)